MSFSAASFNSDESHSNGRAATDHDSPHELVAAAFEALVARASGAASSAEPTRVFLSNHDKRWADNRLAWRLVTELVAYSRDRQKAADRATSTDRLIAAKEHALLSHVYFRSLELYNEVRLSTLRAKA